MRCRNPGDTNVLHNVSVTGTLKSVIFDAEGVVIDTESLWDRGTEEFLRRRGIAYERDKIKPLITGMSLAGGVREMQKLHGFGGDAELLGDERAEIVKDLFRNEAAFIPGFCDFHEKVKKSFKTCIATSMHKELLKIMEERFELSRRFNGNVFSVADVGGVSKPNPDLFLYAARKLNSAPARCVVIEDAPNGIEAAKRAGMKCIALTTTFPRDDLSNADFIVDSYSQIDLSSL